MQEQLNKMTQEWLQIKKTAIKYSTYCKYETLIFHYLDPFFSKQAIETLNEVQIIDYLNGLIQVECLSTSTIHSIKSVLKSVYYYGMQQYKLKPLNFDLIQFNHHPQKKKTLTEIEEGKLYQYCLNHQNKLAFAIMLGLYGGLRLGEICGLKWQDIDLERGILFVNKTVQRLKDKQDSSKTKLYILDPKTFSSAREVILPDFLVTYFKFYYEFYEIDESKETLFLLSLKNRPVDPRTIQRQFTNLCSKKAITATFHTLRHTYATNCIKKGIDVKTVSETLGHANITVTLNRYVHPSFDYKKEQINKIKAPEGLR